MTMKALTRLLFVGFIAVGVAACGGDDGPDESYSCGDGTTLEVLRADEADDDGNIANVRVTGGDLEEAQEIGRVNAEALNELIEACEAS